jgi:hypothetical protein
MDEGMLFIWILDAMKIAHGLIYSTKFVCLNIKNQLTPREPEMSAKFLIIIIKFSYDIVEWSNVWYWSPIYKCSRSMQKQIMIFIIRRITLRWWSFLEQGINYQCYWIVYFPLFLLFMFTSKPRGVLFLLNYMF